MPARPNATEEERGAILQALLTRTKDGKLVKGGIQETAANSRSHPKLFQEYDVALKNPYNPEVFVPM